MLFSEPSKEDIINYKMIFSEHSNIMKSKQKGAFVCNQQHGIPANY